MMRLMLGALFCVAAVLFEAAAAVMLFREGSELGIVWVICGVVLLASGPVMVRIGWDERP